jgi:integrase
MPRDGDGLHLVGAIWHFRYRSPDGRWKEKSTGKRKITEAKIERTKFLRELAEGLLPSDQARWTLEQALDEWFDCRRSTKQPTTLPPERTSIRRLKEILGAKRRLESITATDIRRYQARRRETVGPKTVNNELLVLIGVLKQAKLWKRLEEDYKPLPIPKQGPGKALMPDEGQHLIATARKRPAWDVAFCATLLAYSSGCRSWEIKSLKFKDLMMGSDPAVLRIRRQNTKSDAGARDVALNELALWALKRLLKRAELLGATEPEHYLLPANLSKHTNQKDPLHGRKGYDPTRHQTSWSTAWKNLKAAAGMKNFRFHDLRHTFITQGIENNVPVEVMMAQVGHVSAEMTRYYTHLSSGSKDNAVRKIAARNQGVRSVLEIGEGGAVTGEQPAQDTGIASDPQAASSCASLKKEEHGGE